MCVSVLVADRRTCATDLYASWWRPDRAGLEYPDYRGILWRAQRGRRRRDDEEGGGVKGGGMRRRRRGEEEEVLG